MPTIKWPLYILPKKYIAPYLTRLVVFVYLLPYLMGVSLTVSGFLVCFLLFDLLEFRRIKGLIKEGAL